MIAFDSKMNRQPNSDYYWLQKIGTIFSLLVAIQIIRENLGGRGAVVKMDIVIKCHKGKEGGLLYNFTQFGIFI